MSDSEQKEIIFVSFGTNQLSYETLPFEFLNDIVNQISNLTPNKYIKVSRLWYSLAWPEVTDPPFYNAVIGFESHLSPRELLGKLLRIESQNGRNRDLERRYGPRRLDLDLLAYGSRIIQDEPDLIVPHPRVVERAFILRPWSDIAPQFVHPVLALTISQLAADAQIGQDAYPLDGLL